jgi:hypothetical protein
LDGEGSAIAVATMVAVLLNPAMVTIVTISDQIALFRVLSISHAESLMDEIFYEPADMRHFQ